MSHTPAPWAYHKASSPDNTGGYDYAIVDADGKLIAETFEHVGYRDARSFENRPAKDNAVLIASSPLMLETLKKVMEDYKGLITVCRHYSLHATYKDAMETMEYIENVIKAAGGETV